MYTLLSREQRQRGWPTNGDLEHYARLKLPSSRHASTQALPSRVPTT